MMSEEHRLLDMIQDLEVKLEKSEDRHTELIERIAELEDQWEASERRWADLELNLEECTTMAGRVTAGLKQALFIAYPE
jgi:predicted  nucleic acid-binding Zn-ribbon protein